MKYKRTFVRRVHHPFAYHRTWWFETFRDYGVAVSAGHPEGSYRR